MKLLIKMFILCFVLFFFLGVSLNHTPSNKADKKTCLEATANTAKVALFWPYISGDKSMKKYTNWFWLFVISGSIGSTIYFKRSYIVCASCEQFLGSRLNYEMPCPRCGSNRWKKA